MEIIGRTFDRDGHTFLVVRKPANELQPGDVIDANALERYYAGAGDMSGDAPEAPAGVAWARVVSVDIAEDFDADPAADVVAIVTGGGEWFVPRGLLVPVKGEAGEVAAGAYAYATRDDAIAREIVAASELQPAGESAGELQPVTVLPDVYYSSVESDGWVAGYDSGNGCLAARFEFMAPAPELGPHGWALGKVTFGETIDKARVAEIVAEGSRRILAVAVAAGVLRDGDELRPVDWAWNFANPTEEGVFVSVHVCEETPRVSAFTGVGALVAPM